jgi:hypothetical protein
MRALCGSTEAIMAEPLRKIFQLKVSLIGSKPPIWRRLLVTDSTDLAEFHDIVQTVMGWTDSHLHQFVVGDVRYGIPDPDWDDETICEKDVRIGSALKKPKDWLVYEYDFGDGWEHRVELEKVLPFSPDTDTPVCTGGKNSCPPEDVGGVWGYSDFLEAYKDSSHPEHENVMEWVGEYFDPNEFNIDVVNALLREERGTA